MFNKYARFRDMRPPKVDSNAYSYHLKALQKDGMVEKTSEGYTLSSGGLAYVDKVSLEKFEPRLQAKLTNMLVIRNELDEVLLLSKNKQPFIDAWMLPYGKVHLDDTSIYSAAVREAYEKIQTTPENLKHVGDCYIRTQIAGELITCILAHVFTGEISKDAAIGSNAKWCTVAEMQSLKLAPSTQAVIDRAQSADGFFFEQFDVDWQE